MPAGPADIYEGKLSGLRVKRPGRQITPAVVTVSGHPTDMQPPGSVCITVAPKGSKELRALAQAVGNSDSAAVDKVLMPIKKELQRRKQMDYQAVTEIIEKTSSFVDVSYGGRSLATTLFAIPEVPVSRAILPYLGGSLKPERFEVLEYLQDPAPEAAGLDVLITVHEPELDPAVASVLKQLPADYDTMRIGISPGSRACTITATPIVVAVTVALVATAVAHCTQSWDTKDWLINPIDELSAKAPSLGIAKLLAHREELLGRPVQHA